MIEIDRDHDILAVIDVQPTFMSGGELPVEGGEAVVPVINQLLASCFGHAFATQDWHPRDHSSFASNHPGLAPFDMVEMAYGPQTLWPDHALAGSPNAALHPKLDQSRIELVLRKGLNPATDSYSAFRENDRVTLTGLDGWLRARRFKRLFCTGLALDYCVGWSAEDARDLGYEVFVIEDASRGIGLPLPGGDTSIDAAKRRLVQRGVQLIQTSDLAGA